MAFRQHIPLAAAALVALALLGGSIPLASAIASALVALAPLNGGPRAV